ncbi:MAG: M50 family metallopeptidase [Oscillospiraceae bacterium]|nr:M50 family metallopeptidase [Oscillospiraceae bacterium]
MSVLYIVVGILLFGLLIGIHELGHFITAKLCDVRVNEFAIGMGPAIAKKQKGDTLYSLRLVPFGGFCAMAGEDEASEDPRAFTNKKPLQKLLILAAGSFNNFVLGFLILALLYADAAAFITPSISSFMDGCPYQAQDGLQVGDRFYRIDGKRVYEYYNVSDFLSNGKETHDLVLIRDGQKIELKDYYFVPVEYEGQQRKMYGFTFAQEEATFGTKLANAWDTSREFARTVWMSLGELFKGHVSVNDFSGPVGIVDMMAETAEQAPSIKDGLYDIFYFGAFIAINLAVMNMLPIPAVDGGRTFLLIVTVIIEAITKKKLNPKYEAYIHTAGMVLLLGFMAFIMFNDIIKIVVK